jgi:hypothetical protein
MVADPINTDEFAEIFNQDRKISDKDLHKWIVKFENGTELLRIYKESVSK